MGGYTGRHRAPRPDRGHVARNAAVLAASAAVTAGALASTGPLPAVTGAALADRPPAEGHAVLDAYAESLGARMLDQAESRTGYWYSYGAAGPYAFDCSGLVYWAAQRLGLRNWPRTTYGLLASPRLVRTWHPQRGDLAFYGSGHVEFVTIWYHTTFGAAHSGTRVGWHRWNAWWHPAAFYRIAW